jgi:sulfoquinovosidase
MCDQRDAFPTSSMPGISRRAAIKGMMGTVAAATIASSPRLGSDAWAEVQSSTPHAEKPPGAALETFAAGKFLIDVAEDFIRVRHQADPVRSLWETVPEQPFLQAGIGDAVFREHGNPLGTFEVTDTVSSLSSFTGIHAVQAIDASTIALLGTLSDSESTQAFGLTFRAVADNQLQFVIDVTGQPAEPFNRIFLKYASSSREAFFGFGQQLTFFNQKGKVIPILVQEHGIGRGLPIVTQLVDLLYDGAGGNPYLTEAPAPHYITSQLRSLFLENKEYSVFDLRADNFVALKLFSGVMKGRILYGSSPLGLIEEYTTYAGRMRVLPAWVHEGVMVAAQGGTTVVNELLTQLLAANVPLCGLWIQDWSGTKVTGAGQQVLWNWQLSSQQYPEWEQLVDRLAQHNARVFIYINPFLVPDLCDEDDTDCPSPLYAEAESKGYLVTQHGETFVYINSTIRAGMLDLSNPDARAWMKALIQREMIGHAKASGWMADFGEALPFDADLYAGADPNIWHNHYPEAWAQLHREAIEETGSGDDFLFWNRSGFTQSPGLSTAFWLGDQLQTWDQFDGIKTAVVGLLSGGISGFSLLHSDTGGFVAAEFHNTPVIARSKELLMRWMELNAFTTMFRMHQGLIPSISAQVNTDAETLSHLARFGQVYKALAPYRKGLVHEAATKGYPVVRHLFLHFPDDPVVYTLRYQFLLGPDLLVAPVLDRGAVSVRVYLPAGEWLHLWTGQSFSAGEGRWFQVPAPLGQPGVFFRKGSEAGEQLRATLGESGLL